MLEGESAVWIWLGSDPIRVAQPGHRQWLPLLDSEEEAWLPTVELADGRRLLNQPGLRLGLGTRDDQKELDRRILRQLLTLIDQPALIFAPPHQLAALDALLPDPHAHEVGLAMDGWLLQPTPHAPTQPRQHGKDYYVLDWNAPEQSTVERSLDNVTTLGSAPADPILVQVANFNQGRGYTALSYAEPSFGMVPNEIELRAPIRSARGYGNLGLGLVWTWGFGNKMWQWALKPAPLPNGAHWTLFLESNYLCRVTDASSDEVLHTQLQQPRWGMHLSESGATT
ncbi:MAG: hypothetical protein ACPGUC_07955 [Gammaproteobacteria bacterium]